MPRRPRNAKPLQKPRKNKVFRRPMVASWRRLGGSWRRLGGVLEALGGVLETPGGVVEAMLS